MRCVLYAIILLCWSQPLAAESANTDASQYFDAPSQELGLSRDLMMAIARVESGIKPWVLNIEGLPYSFDSKNEALDKAREAWAAGSSFDVGLMQINSQWLRRYGISLEAALDPLANAYFGAWIFKQELVRLGNLKAAIGAYHSPTPARASQYADLVMAALERGPQSLERSPSPKAQDDSQPVEKLEKRQAKAVTPAPSESGMLVVSQKGGLANAASMKAAPSLPANSMIVRQKKEVEP